MAFNLGVREDFSQEYVWMNNLEGIHFQLFHLFFYSFPKWLCPRRGLTQEEGFQEVLLLRDEE